MNTLAVAVLACAFAISTDSQPSSEPSRAIRAEVTVAAGLADVWTAWSTEAGVRTFFAPDARIGNAPGGAYELFFHPSNPPGSRGAEGSVITAMQPQRMLAFTWGQPPALTALRGQYTSVVVRFAAVGPAATRVSLESTGFGIGGDWDRSFEFFTAGWPQVLCNLKTRFDRGPVDWAGASPYVTPFDCGSAVSHSGPASPGAPGGTLQDLAWLVGGTWSAQTTDPAGGPLVVDVRYRWTNHRRAIAYEIVTRAGDRVKPTHEGLIWLDGVTRRVTLAEVDEQGHAVRGTVLFGTGRIDITETMNTAGGATHQQRAEIVRRGDDAFTFVAYFLKNDEWVHAITFDYRRRAAGGS